MYLYIIIGLIVVIILISTYNKKSKEHFETCYLGVGNTKKNGDKTFFTNYMLGDYFKREKTINGLKETDEKTVQTLDKFKKNIYQSNNEYTRLNNEYNQLNNNMEREFNKLDNLLQNKMNEKNTLRQDAINKFNKIDTKMNQFVGGSESLLENKLKPMVNSTINNNLDQIKDDTITNINTNNIFNNRISSINSDINNWKIIPGYGSPMRIDPVSGDVQCLSYNSRDCEWGYVQQNGNDLNKINTSNVKPLTCGSDHKKKWGGIGYDIDNHWCKKVYDIYSSSNINEVDWSNCPVGWTNLDKEGNQCQAPSDYTGRCNKVSTFTGYSPQNKQGWAAGCTARWPFKVNINNTVKDMGDIPATISEDVNNKLGKIIPKTDLDNFKTYNNGVYVKAYKLTNNNSPGELLRDGIITTNINFNWGVGLIFGIRDNPNQTDTNMIYLEMIGYIKVPAGVTSIKFRLGSDDGSRLLISDNGEISSIKTVIEMWQPQGHTTKESNNLTVKPYTYLPFVIQFFENYGAASLILEWSINNGAYAIVPRDVFYINKELCNAKFNFNYIQELNTKVQPQLPLIPVFNKDSNTATTTEGTYTVSIWRCYTYPCYNITTSGYINGGSFGSIFDNNDTTGVDMESYSPTPTGNFGFPYRIVVSLPVLKKFNGTLNMKLTSPWFGCLPQNMTLNTLSMSSDFTSNQNWYSPFGNFFSQQNISSSYLETINLGQVGNSNNGPTTHSWNVNLTKPFNIIVFEILTGWGSGGRGGSNSVWITSINFDQEQKNINSDDIAIVKGISPSLISWNWSPFNFSSYANGNCPCRAGYRLVYVYNSNVVSQVSGENWAQNCPTYCNPVLTFNINLANISSVNDISKLKLVLQVNKNNGTWVNSSCPPLQVVKGQSTYVFNCATSQ